MTRLGTVGGETRKRTEHVPLRGLSGTRSVAALFGTTRMLGPPTAVTVLPSGSSWASPESDTVRVPPRQCSRDQLTKGPDQVSFG